jgi:hypothetical protein
MRAGSSSLSRKFRLECGPEVQAWAGSPDNGTFSRRHNSLIRTRNWTFHICFLTISTRGTQWWSLLHILTTSQNGHFWPSWHILITLSSGPQNYRCKENKQSNQATCC